MSRNPESSAGLILRPVTRDDADVLFRWLNAADRRLASFQTSNPVAWQDHVEWLDRRVADPGNWHAIAICGGMPAGQVRAERQDTGVVVSIYVDAAFRGRGVGRTMIDDLCETVRERWPGLPILAHVRADNPRSIAFFTTNGFSAVMQSGDRVTLQRT